VTGLEEWEKLIPRPRSKFIRVKCPECGNEQIIFNYVSTDVHCNVCRGLLAEPSGGKAKVKGEILGELE